MTTKIKEDYLLIYLEVLCPKCESIWTCPINHKEYDNEFAQGIYPTEITCPSCVQNENHGVQLELLFA